MSEVFKTQISGSPLEAIGWLQPLPGRVRAVYEAGPTGFGLARAARDAGVEVMVCAPGAIPRQPGDDTKTDTRDALKDRATSPAQTVRRPARARRWTLIGWSGGQRDVEGASPL